MSLATPLALQQIIEPAVAALGLEFVGCELVKAHGGRLLRVYIDSATGVNMDDCALASRQISAALDVADPIADSYTLEVSSPGLDRVLFSIDHYKRFIGSKVKLRLRVALEGQRNYVGTITAVNVDEQIVEIDVASGESKLIELNLGDIDRANLVPEL